MDEFTKTEKTGISVLMVSKQGPRQPLVQPNRQSLLQDTVQRTTVHISFSFMLTTFQRIVQVVLGRSSTISDNWG